MSTVEYHDESGADDDDVVVIPVPDELSDGTEETWRLNDSQFQYRMIDDSRWRLSLAQMWVEKTGAAEKGMLLLSLLSALLYVGHLSVAPAFAPISSRYGPEQSRPSLEQMPHVFSIGANSEILCSVYNSCSAQGNQLPSHIMGYMFFRLMILEHRLMSRLMLGVTYILEKMPAGYCLFDRPRGTDSSMVSTFVLAVLFTTCSLSKKRDPFVFGHPSGFYFQSRITFFPHFYWLMTGRKGSCECKNCERAAKGGVPHKRECLLVQVFFIN